MGIQLKDLPPSNFVAIVKATDRKLLSEAIRNTLGSIDYSTTVHGGQRSIRLLASRPFPGSIHHLSSMDSWEAATELVKLAEAEARYDPTQKEGHQKGLEVRELSLASTPVILVQTTWVD